MAVELIRVALDIEARGGSCSKLVLVVLADCACARCGLAWPGTPLMAERAQLGRTRVREALDELASDGHLAVHAYPNGGRGKTTEFIVLPKHVAESAPCSACEFRRKLRSGSSS